MNTNTKKPELRPDRFSMIRIYEGTNGVRVVDHRNLTWVQCNDTSHFPLGVVTDSEGRGFRYSQVLTECLEPSTNTRR